MMTPDEVQSSASTRGCGSYRSEHLQTKPVWIEVCVYSRNDQSIEMGENAMNRMSYVADGRKKTGSSSSSCSIYYYTPTSISIRGINLLLLPHISRANRTAMLHFGRIMAHTTEQMPSTLVLSTPTRTSQARPPSVSSTSWIMEGNLGDRWKSKVERYHSLWGFRPCQPIRPIARPRWKFRICSKGWLQYNTLSLVKGHVACVQHTIPINIERVEKQRERQRIGLLVAVKALSGTRGTLDVHRTVYSIMILSPIRFGDLPGR